MGTDWADLMAKEWMQLLRYIYKHKSIPSDTIYFPIVEAQGRQFANGIDEVFGEPVFDSPDYVLREILKQNAWDFSVAKNYNDVIAINNLLLNEEGALRPWHDFKHEAQKIVGNSTRYLKTEYNTVVASAQMSRLYQEIQRDKHIFPFVQFDVIMDGHTSDICTPLNDVIVTVDDPMLVYYFPPNHFNCRTTLRKLRYGVPTKKYQLPKIPEAFKNNPAKSGKIFTDDNRYIANTPVLLLEEVKRKIRDIETWEVIPTERGIIKMSSKHRKSERTENIEIASYFTNKYGHEIHLLGASDTEKTADTFNKTLGIKQEYKRNQRPTRSAIDNEIRDGKDQADHIVLDIKSEIDDDSLKRAIKGRVKRSKNIKSITIIKDNEDVTYTRDDIMKWIFNRQ